MKRFLYDGSFEGLLTCIYKGYYDGHPDMISSLMDYENNFLYEDSIINTDLGLSDKVYMAIIQKISYEFLNFVYTAFLSENTEIGYMIYIAIKTAFKKRKDISANLQDENIRKLNEIKRQVTFEVHRFTGLLRFQKLKNETYYAMYEPDNNITQLLTPHFTERLRDQKFIIHDKKRSIASLYNGSEWTITDLEEFKPKLADNEKNFQSMFKTFYDSIFIESRKNHKLRYQFMPRRYFKYLIEVNDSV